MANSVKRKIRLGTMFLFLLLVLSGGVGIYHIVRLKDDSKEILKDNYESLEYCHAMQRLLNFRMTNNPESLAGFDSVLNLQETNITEPGEKEATAAIRQNFNQYRLGEMPLSVTRKMESDIQRIISANMSTIEVKNRKAARTADNALTFITFIAAIILLVGITFAFNFPSVLTAPIASLTEGIQEISRKNYHYRIHLNRKDEFGQMAEAFNDMAERLEYFENSSLNRLIFEKARAEAVINSLKDASLGVDKNGLVLFANNQALQLLALQAKDIIGQPVDDVCKRNDLLRFLLEEKGNLPFKIVVDNRENYFTKETMDITQEGANSKVIVLRNVTSFKELDVARTNFISTISHELKTPLASSDFSLKLLEDERVGHLSDEQKDLIQSLKYDNQRMLKILSELLNMSQVEAGKIELNIQKVNPGLIADSAINSVLNAAKSKNIEIKTNYERNAGDIMADAEKTGWVLTNFLSNAVKHAPERSTIIVSVNSMGAKIRFSVSDEGPGISSEYSAKIFERFFKVPGSNIGGTGLGLAISKEFIDAQGGEIWVKSEKGAGSIFGFDLSAFNGI